MVSTIKLHITCFFALSLLILSSCAKGKGDISPLSTSTAAAASLEGYKRYQTFDEFAMKGEGAVTAKPFVYVLDKGDEISVRRSDDIDIEYVYHHRKDNGGYWLQVVSRDDMGKFVNSDVRKDVFYRFFFNDSIVEWNYKKFDSDGGIVSNAVYVKTRNEFVLINLDLKRLFSTKSNLQAKVAKVARNYHAMKNLAAVDRRIGVYGNGMANTYMTYHVDNEKDSIHATFQGLKQTCSLTFNGGPLAMLNTNFGFEKAVSKKVTINRNYPQETIDGAYESKHLDTKPIPADGDVTYTRNGLETHRVPNAPFLAKQFFVLKLKVDESGKVEDAVVILSDGNKSHEEMAKKVCAKFKYKRAGKRKGGPVKSWNYVKLVAGDK